jgi:2,4-dienoyl-CoA reductase-like NADH-dependent reductase (Old Yellow Enzyme family)
MPNGTHLASLFSPLEVRNRRLPNRIVMAPMGSNYTSEGGFVSESSIVYYARRAEHGVGTIIVEATNVDRKGLLSRFQTGVWDDAFIPQFKKLTSAVHSHGALILLQLTHGGAKAMPHLDDAPIGPSAVQIGAKIPRPIEADEIPALQQKYVDAARRALEAGFDGVEIHACHLHLISQFLSPYTNRRDDAYGGSVENRARFLIETVRRTREQLGRGFLVSCRINGYELFEGGVRVEEAAQTAQLLEQEDIDIVSVSALSQFLAFTFEGRRYRYPTSVLPKDAPDAHNTQYAAAVKRAIRKPVMACGKVLSPGVAERLLQEGRADLIAIGRALIADPAFAEKAARGEAVTRCIECNACIKMATVKDLPLGCPVNQEFREYHEYRDKESERWLAQAVGESGG